MTPPYGVILFHTTSAAMRAEKLLMSAAYDIKLIPTPREFSSDCSLAIRFLWQDKDRIDSLIESSKIEIVGINPLP
ncbi:MAG: DUF3343 domain-containing protein [bacterium]